MTYLLQDSFLCDSGVVLLPIILIFHISWVPTLFTMFLGLFPTLSNDSEPEALRREAATPKRGVTDSSRHHMVGPHLTHRRMASRQL